MQSATKYLNHSIQTIAVISVTRNLLMGAGLAYCIQQKNYLHIPLVVIFPSPYAGYHIYKNQDAILKVVKELK